MTTATTARQAASVMRLYNGKEKKSAGNPTVRTGRFGTPAGAIGFE
jgi:hypothetical protein